MDSVQPSAIPPLPPSPVFESFDQIYDYLQGFYRENGAALVKRSSGGKRMINGNFIPTHIILGCDRGRGRPSKSLGLRSSSTTKINCPFKVTAKTSLKAKGMWTYTVHGDGIHNHLQSLHPSAHQVHRKRTPAQKNLVRVLSEQRELSARSVHNIVLNTSSTAESFFTQRDIYNDRRAIKKEALRGSLPT